MDISLLWSVPAAIYNGIHDFLSVLPFGGFLAWLFQTTFWLAILYLVYRITPSPVWKWVRLVFSKIWPWIRPYIGSALDAMRKFLGRLLAGDDILSPSNRQEKIVEKIVYKDRIVYKSRSFKFYLRSIMFGFALGVTTTLVFQNWDTVAPFLWGLLEKVPTTVK